MSELPEIWCLKNGERAKYFLIGPITCDGCQGELGVGHIAFHLMNWKRGEAQKYVFCADCLKKGMMPKGPIPPNLYTQERRMCIVVEGVKGLPGGCFPVQLVHHGLTDARNITTIEAVSSRLTPAERVIDHTRLAGRPEFTCLDDSAPVILGLPNMKGMKKKDHALETREGIAFLEDLAKAQPLLTAEEKKMIGEKNE